jgi:hypothetical protein
MRFTNTNPDPVPECLRARLLSSCEKLATAFPIDSQSGLNFTAFPGKMTNI